MSVFQHFDFDSLLNSFPFLLDASQNSGFGIIITFYEWLTGVRWPSQQTDKGLEHDGAQFDFCRGHFNTFTDIHSFLDFSDEWRAAQS